MAEDERVSRETDFTLCASSASLFRDWRNPEGEIFLHQPSCRLSFFFDMCAAGDLILNACKWRCDGLHLPVKLKSLRRLHWTWSKRLAHRQSKELAGRGQPVTTRENRTRSFGRDVTWSLHSICLFETHAFMEKRDACAHTQMHNNVGWSLLATMG